MTKQEIEKLIIDFVIEKGLKVEILEDEDIPAYFCNENNVLTVWFYYEETKDDKPYALQSVG
tara:strand:+ start:2341 stop:2526 length:186 start_codon:yes stop_codon:yes gene_type:complete